MVILKQQRLIVLVVRTGDKYTSKTAVTCCFILFSSQMQVPNEEKKRPLHDGPYLLIFGSLTEKEFQNES